MVYRVIVEQHAAEQMNLYMLALVGDGIGSKYLAVPIVPTERLNDSAFIGYDLFHAASHIRFRLGHMSSEFWSSRLAASIRQRLRYICALTATF